MGLIDYLKLILLFALTSCAANSFVPEQEESANLILFPAARPAELVTEPIGLDDYLVISEEQVSLFYDSPEYLEQRGMLIGAQKALLLKQEKTHETRVVKRYCWGCLLLDVALITANSYMAGTITGVPNIDYGYETEVDINNYNYHVVYLIHPDSISLPDKVRAVEFYDAADKELLATAYFDWNEQLQRIDGSAKLPLFWLNTQPLGFMNQHNERWQSRYNEKKNMLFRYNTDLGYNYKIRPQGADEYDVEVTAATREINLLTIYYGQHDWTVGSTDKSNPLRIDYYLDNLGRMYYMKVVDSWSGTPTQYHVRIYYRDSDETFPEAWRWRSYHPQIE